MAREQTETRKEHGARERFEQWRPWFEGGSWLVLVGGFAGAVLRFASTLRLAYARQDELTLLDIWRSSQVMGAIGQALLDIALVAFLFLVMRLLILGIPALLRHKDTE